MLTEYEIADALLTAAFPAYNKARDDYRDRKIGDAEYLRIRREYDAAKEVWEAARAKAYPGT